MNRKECNHTRRAGLIAAMTALVVAGPPRSAAGDTVRIWPTAVVAGDTVTLGDICDLSQIDAETRESIRSATVVAAPPPGGSSLIPASEIQKALKRAGVNLAAVVLTGATRCALTRPHDATTARPDASQDAAHAGRTLAEAVRAAFQQRAKAYGGRIELQFGRTSPQILRLSEPDYRFDVDIPGGRWLGRMIAVDVDVVSNEPAAQPPNENENGPRHVSASPDTAADAAVDTAGDTNARTVHLVVNASMTRRVVVARRAINFKATIRPEDVELANRTYESADRIGAITRAAVVGQRARRFLSAGSTIRMADLETVPLIKRGQLVDVVSVAGGIEVRSVAKAAGTGGLGDTVELRVGEGRGTRLTGIVTGERRAVVGRPPSHETAGGASLALGATRVP